MARREYYEGVSHLTHSDSFCNSLEFFLSRKCIVQKLYSYCTAHFCRKNKGIDSTIIDFRSNDTSQYVNDLKLYVGAASRTTTTSDSVVICIRNAFEACEHDFSGNTQGMVKTIYKVLSGSHEVFSKLNLFLISLRNQE